MIHLASNRLSGSSFAFCLDMLLVLDRGHESAHWSSISFALISILLGHVLVLWSAIVWGSRLIALCAVFKLYLPCCLLYITGKSSTLAYWWKSSRSICDSCWLRYRGFLEWCKTVETWSCLQTSCELKPSYHCFLETISSVCVCVCFLLLSFPFFSP